MVKRWLASTETIGGETIVREANRRYFAAKSTVDSLVGIVIGPTGPIIPIFGTKWGPRGVEPNMHLDNSQGFGGSGGMGEEEREDEQEEKQQFFGSGHREIVECLASGVKLESR